MKYLLLQTLLNHIITKGMIFSVWDGDTFLISRHSTEKIDTAKTLRMMAKYGYLHFRIYPTKTALMPISWVMIDFERCQQSGQYDFYDYNGGSFARKWNMDFVHLYAESKAVAKNGKTYHREDYL